MKIKQKNRTKNIDDININVRKKILAKVVISLKNKEIRDIQIMKQAKSNIYTHKQKFEKIYIKKKERIIKMPKKYSQKY